LIYANYVININNNIKYNKLILLKEMKDCVNIANILDYFNIIIKIILKII